MVLVVKSLFLDYLSLPLIDKLGREERLDLEVQAPSTGRSFASIARFAHSFLLQVHAQSIQFIRLESQTIFIIYVFLCLLANHAQELA